MIAEALERRANEALRNRTAVLSAPEEDELARAAFDALFRLNRLQRLLDDPAIENINANGCDQVWVRYADGRREQVEPIAASDDELEEMLRTAAARTGIGERRFDRGSPRLSLQLPDGSRLFALMAVAARPCLSIRRHRYLRITPDDLVEDGHPRHRHCASSSGPPCWPRSRASSAAAPGRARPPCCGPWPRTSHPPSGWSPSRTPSSSASTASPNCTPTSWRSRPREPNLEGEGGVSLAELVRWALRMSPRPGHRRRGPRRGSPGPAQRHEPGHRRVDGHPARLVSSKGAFSKLATYAVQAPERLPLEATNLLVANAVHFVIHLAQDGDRRFVASVREVVDAEGPMVVSNEIFRPGPDGRAVPGAPMRNETLDQLAAVGFDPGLLDRPQGWWET